jgi:hypothetical protein
MVQGIIIRSRWTRAKVERATWRVVPFMKNLQMHHEGRRATKDVGSKRPLYLRKKRMITIGIGGWSSGQLSPLGRGGPTYKTLKNILELEFVKRANRMSSRLQRIMDWTLCRGRPPQKGKRNCR